MEDKDYIIRDNTGLSGSGFLKDSSKDHVDRVQYMIENMKFNHAYISNLKINNYANENDLLEEYKDRFLKYRVDWNQQPQNSIKYNMLGPDMKRDNLPPLCLDIEVASICDLACPFCFREFIATPDKIIDEDLCYNLIDQAAELKIPSIKFNWRGEPLLHPKLPEFIKYSKERGILDTIINTNATTLGEKKCRALIDAGLDYIIYSFDGGSKKTYEKNRPGRFKTNSFDSVYKNIQTLKKIKDEMKSPFPFTKIQMILTEETFNEKDNFYNLFNDYVDDVTVNPYTERGGQLSDLDEEGREEYEKIRAKYGLPEESAYMRDPHGKIFVSQRRKPCEQPYQRLLVTYEGRVAMCCYDWGATHPVGYVSEEAFNNKKVYKDVMQSVESGKKGFELLSEIKMPSELNDPKKTVLSIKDIWYGKEIDNVRDSHLKNCADKLEICKNCTFKDTFDWID